MIFLMPLTANLNQKVIFFAVWRQKTRGKHRLLKKYPPVLNYIYYFF